MAKHIMEDGMCDHKQGWGKGGDYVKVLRAGKGVKVCLRSHYSLVDQP